MFESWVLILLNLSSFDFFSFFFLSSDSSYIVRSSLRRGWSNLLGFSLRFLSWRMLRSYCFLLMSYNKRFLLRNRGDRLWLNDRSTCWRSLRLRCLLNWRIVMIISWSIWFRSWFWWVKRLLRFLLQSWILWFLLNFLINWPLRLYLRLNFLRFCNWYLFYFLSRCGRLEIFMCISILIHELLLM